MQGQPRHELTRLREKGYLHEATRDAIKEYIVANSLRAGDALPSEGELADTFGVTITRIVRASAQPTGAERVRIVLAELGELGSLIGAARMVFEPKWALTGA